MQSLPKQLKQQSKPERMYALGLNKEIQNNNKEKVCPDGEDYL